ncbi:hypothetical protein OG883_01320 [Streptomyces sp. NBC_01142]|uniref:hypothetical protein n=1 Tax=Streptomyces sp. NBC_01142 TaxID=2975865 RepID=UPI00225567CF|nr:hypothetical protein [Streptomyces sp. NBC_01142]MCX4818567.1 hypothetical protein [Streptomyces sp. NBC_01142]
MSLTGVWAIGAVPDAEVAALPGRFVHLEGEWTTPPGYADDLAWWLSGGDREPYFTPQPTPAALRFAAFARSGGPSAPAVTAMKEAGMDLLRDADGSGSEGSGTEAGSAVFVAAARKGDPAAALCYGLGAEGAARLPGWFGDFLLTAAEVRAVLPHAESVLAVTGPRRSEILARMDAWMSAMSDAPDFDVRTLLDGPLRVLRFAAAHGTGAVGVTENY